MKKLVLLLIVSLLASSSFAQVFPVPDIMGIYFDQDGWINCLGAMPAGQLFTTYIILTNPTAASINAYELGYRLEVPAGTENNIFRLSDSIANGVVSGIDVGDASRVLRGDYIVGLASPIPAAPATVLHSMEYMLTATISVQWFIGASSAPSIPGDYPVVQDAQGSILMQVGVSSGSLEWPVAMINVGCGFAVDQTSFGSVKSLYR